MLQLDQTLATLMFQQGRMIRIPMLQQDQIQVIVTWHKEKIWLQHIHR
jgi:hypothetical protein